MISSAVVSWVMRAERCSPTWPAEAAPPPAHRRMADAHRGKARLVMERPSAERAYAALLDPAAGIYRDLRIDRDGLATVLRLRSTYEPARKQLTAPDRYVDLSYLDAALKAK
jgi:hypothetical protein